MSSKLCFVLIEMKITFIIMQFVAWRQPSIYVNLFSNSVPQHIRHHTVTCSSQRTTHLNDNGSFGVNDVILSNDQHETCIMSLAQTRCSQKLSADYRSSISGTIRNSHLHISEIIQYNVVLIY